MQKVTQFLYFFFIIYLFISLFFIISLFLKEVNPFLKWYVGSLSHK